MFGFEIGIKSCKYRITGDKKVLKTSCINQLIKCFLNTQLKYVNKKTHNNCSTREQ